MKLKASAPTIDPQNPFAEDSLARREQAETLTKIIQDIREPFVLAIDAPFGMGKSTFIHMWKAALEVKGFRTLHFNAWANDFTENALVAVLGEFRKELEKEGKENGTTEVWRKAKKAGGVLARSAIPTVIKAATASLIDIEKIGDAIADAAEKAAEKGIERYEEDKRTIVAFKDELTKFIAKTTPDKPLVFFIDELDRCRPLFAIEVLEHTKHLFNIDGIVFVLGVNKMQLGHSIKAVYGADLDLNGYFGRLIDITYSLPPPEIALFVAGIQKRLTTLTTIKNQLGQPIKSEDIGIVQAAASLLGEYFRFPLRTIEQLYIQVLLTWKILIEPINPVLVVGLVFCREGDRQAFDNLFKVSGPLSSLIDQLKRIRERNRNSIVGLAAAELSAAFRMFQIPEAEQANFLAAGRERGFQGWEREDFLNVRSRRERYILTEQQRKMVMKSVHLTQPFIAVLNADIKLAPVTLSIQTEVDAPQQ